jgi:hypothetical protein
MRVKTETEKTNHFISGVYGRMLNRKFLIKLHLVLAAVVLSISAMFFITGGLYTFDYEPSSRAKEYRFKQSKPLQLKLNPLKTMAREKLAKLHVDEPFGKAKIKYDKKRQAYKLVWKGNNHSVVLRASTSDSSVAVLTIITPSWYKRLMRLHKGKGGDVFNVFSIIASVALLLILLSGVIIGLQLTAFRKLTLYSLAGGLLLFAAMVIFAQF